MILKVDARALEWRSYVELSRDPIGLEEIVDGQDVHYNNQTFFVLPERLIAKKFLFRWIYRGSAWAYANDNEFKGTSSDPAYWEDVIQKANDKYKVLIDYQNKLIWRAERKEVITIPSGREFLFDVSKDSYGNPYWDIKKIVNYINQGFGADIMMVGRVMLRNRMSKYKASDVKLMNTVHDDFQLDVANDPVLLYNICIELEEIFKDIPKQFSKYFKTDFVTPLAGEVSFGHNLYELTTFERTKGESQFL